MAKQTSTLKHHSSLGWIVAAILLLILLFLGLASHYRWWPYHKVALGTAFYSGITAKDSGATGSTTGHSSSSGNGSSSGSSSTGSGNSGGSSSSGSGSSSSGTGSTSSTPSILTFSATVNSGDTKTQVSGQAKSDGLNENCAVLATSTVAGKEEVCTYTQGSKVVTVTYLNNKTVSASRTGF